MIIDCINARTKKYYNDLTDVVHSSSVTINEFGKAFAISFKKELYRLSASDSFEDYQRCGWSTVRKSSMVQGGYELSITSTYSIVIITCNDIKEKEHTIVLEGVIEYDGHEKKWAIR